MTVLLLCAVTVETVSASPSPSPTAPPRKSKKVDESEKPPFIGMTKAQTLARYGQPKKRTITSQGEHWLYFLNYGEVLGKAFIPFNFHHTPLRTAVLIFGADGKVNNFTWDAETD
jgi:hypothetical protein